MAPAPAAPGVPWALFGVNGRLWRQPYVLGQLFWFGPMLVVVRQILKVQGDEEATALWGLAFIVLAAISVWSSVALTMKRLNDLSWPRILAVTLFVPWVGVGFALLLCFLPGDRNHNPHGPPPV